MAYIGSGISRFNTADELTVTGDATIDTTTLVVDSTNNRVGIGIAAPSEELEISGTGVQTLKVDRTDASTAGALTINSANGSNYIYNLTAKKLIFGTNNNSGLTLDENNKIGIGTTAPERDLHVKGASGDPVHFKLEGDPADYARIMFDDGTTDNIGELRYNFGSDYMSFNTNSAERMRLTSAGSLGLGTSSPDATLTVQNATSSGATIKYDGQSNSEFGLRIQSNVSGGNFESDFANGSTALLDLFANSSATSGGDLLVARTQSSTPVFLVKGSGSVGIGTASPDTTMHIHTSSAGTVDAVSGGVLTLEKNNHAVLQFLTPNDKKAIIYFGDPDDIDAGRLEYDHSSNSMLFNVNAAERMRIDSSGNVLVGTTTNDIYDSSSEVGSQISDGYLAVARASTVAYFNRLSSDGDIVEFRKGGTTVGSIGTLSGRMYTGTGDVGLFFDSTNNMITPYSIDAGDTVDNTIDLGYSSRRFKDGYFSNGITARYHYNIDDPDTYIDFATGNLIKFFTGGSERGRFSATGSLLVAQSASDTPGISNTTQGAAIGSTGRIHSSVNGAFSSFNRNSSDGGVIQFHREGNKVGEITVNSSSTAYVTSSDRRLKSNIEDAASASDKIDAIQVRQFDWNADDSHQDYGLIAQELQPIEPMAVTGDADSDEMMGVDYSKLVPMLIKEIQELRSRVATLEAN